MRVQPFLLLGAALLPYLSGNLRFEHVAIPALTAWAILQARRVHPETAWIVGGLMIGALATAFFSRYSYLTGAMSDPLPQFIRLILPALMMATFPSLVPQDEDSSIHMAKATVVLGGICASFTAISLVSGPVNGLLVLWVRSDEGGTWFSSQDIGRYTGIFNQPIEAGIFYSIALIAVIHLLRYTKMSRTLLIAAMIVISFGGAASLSKNFIVLGAAAAVGYAFLIRLISRNAVLVLSIPIIISAPVLLERVNQNYFDSLKYLYNEGGILAALSAGRFGYSEASVSILFDSLVSSGDWLAGRGLGSQLPLDNGFLEYLYQGGILALLGYIVALTALTIYAWKNRAYRDAKLLLIIMAYTWLASTGGPAITASRAGTALLLLVSACLASIRANLDPSPRSAQGLGQVRSAVLSVH